MNKKLNTLVFFLVATALNIVLVFVLAIAVFIPYAAFVAPLLTGSLRTINLIALVVIVVGAMAGSFPIYRWIVARFQKKVDMEKYFDPIVKTRSRSRR